MAIVKTPETKVKNTCDQLIAWGFCCSNPAAFLVKKQNSPEYAIMCVKHKTEFYNRYPDENVFYYEWSLELNQEFADSAKEYWGKTLMPLEPNPNNPFEFMMCGSIVQSFDSASRIEKVKTFNAEQLRRVIFLTGVQKTVRDAAERRLRKLEKLEKNDE